MTSFPLKIVTLDGLFYDGEAEEIIVRTTMGDMGVLAGHLNCVAPLGMGRATIVINGQKRYASCIGGIIFVLGGEVKLDHPEKSAAELKGLLREECQAIWAEDIDVARSEQVAERARRILADPDATPQQLHNAEAHLKRAQVRINVAQQRSN